MIIDSIHRSGRAVFNVLRAPMARAFEGTQNPLNHLGALTVFFLWVVLVSGIWLLIFFRTSVSGAFDSVEYLTHEQWYVGGIMRSLHRYASDAAIVTILVHVIKEFVFNRYRRNRWFSWVTGVPLIWMIFPLGLTGYWLVWDQLAQYVAISSAELIDRVPIFTDSMARNFLSDDLLSDRFFTLMAFLHLIGLPIFLVFGVWLHVFRLTAPRINPPRRMMAASLLCLLILSAVFPAISHDRADLAMATQTLRLDWFYLHVFPLIKHWSPGWVWMLLVGVSAAIVVAPWAPPQRKESPALVTLEYCNGCERCADDCPFGAIDMVPRSDDKSYMQEATVDPELCTSCGLCVGACPTATPFRSKSALVPGIDLPERTAASLREEIVGSAAQRASPDILVFACRSDPQTKSLQDTDVRVVELNCMGQLPPSYIDFILSRNHADGVFLMGCQDGNCDFRLGATWTEQRLSRSRDPMLRKRVDLSRIGMGWTSPWSAYSDIAQRIAAFRESLSR